MNVYRTEDEQVELLKRLLRTYGPAIILGVVIALVANYGWQYYQRAELNTTQTAATQYEFLLTSMSQQDTKTANTTADTLMNDYARTPYASLAGLAKARLSVDAHNNKDAVAALTWVQTHSQDPTLATLATIRLARIDLQEQHPDAALSRLTALKDSTPYTGLVDDVEGDAYAALHQIPQAKHAYQAALAALPADSQPLISMKLAQLGYPL